MSSNRSSPETHLQFLEHDIHDDGNPYCTICGKIFKRMYALERHMIVHDPQRARLEHRCPHEGCKFSSLQKSNVKTHIAAVHEKIKHTCTLLRIVDGSLSFGVSTSERCGRIFSDAPALIRHEKRAHGFYRRLGRGVPAGTKPKKRAVASVVQTQPRAVGTSSSIVTTSVLPVEDLWEQSASGSSPPVEKVQYWLQTSDMRVDSEIERDSENVTPTTGVSKSRVALRDSELSCATVTVSAATAASISAPASDAESFTTSSISSSVSTSPSLVTESLDLHFPSILAYPPTYSITYCYPGASDPASHPYSGNTEFHLSPANFAQTQTSGAIYYDNAESPPAEAWMRPLAEMKRVMQASGAYDGRYEWDGVITGLSLLD